MEDIASIRMSRRQCECAVQTPKFDGANTYYSNTGIEPLMTRLNSNYWNNSMSSTASSSYSSIRQPLQQSKAGTAMDNNNQFSSYDPHTSSSSGNGNGSGSGSKMNGKAKPVSYEQFAPRNADLRSKLAKVQSLTAGPIRAVSANNPIHDTNTGTTDSFNGKSYFLKAMVPLGNTNTNHTITNDTIPDAIHGAEIIATLRTTTNTSNHISKILDSTSNLHTTLLKTSSLAQSITNRHTSLLQHSSELSLSAERLQHESDQLAQHAIEIGLPLKHYDAVDRLGLQVGVLFKKGTVVKGLAKIKVDEGDFVGVLVDVDAAVNFFAERSEISTAQQQQYELNQQNDPNGTRNLDPASQEGSGSIEYYKRSLALQEKCMDLFKDAIVDRIIQTSVQIHSALDLKRKSISGDTLGASLIYTRFHGISSRSRYLLKTIKERMGSTVLVPIVRSRKEYLYTKSIDFAEFELASVFLMRLCTAETALYLDFFGQDEEEEGGESNRKESESA
eukprot:scaffold5936_cov268-Chaetoceros_neogracile.AAC.25